MIFRAKGDGLGITSPFGFNGISNWLQNGFGGGAIDEAAITNYNNAITSGIAPQQALANATANTNKNTIKLISSANGGVVSEEALSNATQTTTLKMRAQALGVKALSVALNVGLMIAISVVIKGITEMAQAWEQVSKQAAEATSKYKEQASTIDDYKSKITELKNALSNNNITYAEARDKRSQLLDIQKELIDTYGSEASGIDLVNGSLDEQIGKLEKINELKRQEWENEVNKLTTGQKWQRASAYAGITVVGNMLLPFLGNQLGDKWLNNFDTTTNIDRITEKVENFSKSIKINTRELNLSADELKNLKKQMESYEGVSIDENKITFSGDAKTVAETVAKIQSQVIGSRKDLQGLDQQLKDVYNSAKNIVDENWDTYNQAIENKILNDEKGLEYYGKLTQAASDYQEALKDGNDANIQDATEEYMAILTEISNSDLPDAFKKHFENMYPELSEIINNWVFEVNIKPKIENNEDNFKDYLQKLENITTDEISSIFDNNGEGVSDDVWDAIIALNTIAQSSGLDLSDFLKQLNEAGYLVSQLDKDIEETIKNTKKKLGRDTDWKAFFDKYSIDTEEELDKWNEIVEITDSAEEAMDAYASAVEDAANSVENLNKQLDDIQTAYSAVQSAIEEYNEQGYLSVDTYQGLLSIEPKYLKYLMDEEGNLNLTTDALNAYTSALIDNTANKQIQGILDYVATLESEERQMYLSKNAADEATKGLIDFTAAIAQTKFAAGELTKEELNNLTTMLGSVAAWAENTKKGIGKGGLAKSSNSSNKSEKEKAEKAQEYADKVKEINEDLAEKEKEFAEKMDEAWKKEHLETLKDALEERKDIIDRYKKDIEISDFGLETVETDDFSTKVDLLTSKIEKITDYGKAMREEFDRVANIIPETADEAQELANRLEELGSDMRSNVSDLRKTQIELQKLEIDMANALIDDRTKELQSVIDNIDKRIEILNSDHKDEYKYVNQMLNMDLLLPTYSTADKKRREKRREDKALIDTEQETQDKINEIVTKSLEMQAKENKEAREKERQELIKDMEKTRKEAQKKLDDAQKDYQKFLDDAETATKATIGNITDIVNNANLKLPKVDISDFEKSILNAKQKINDFFGWTQSAVGGDNASSVLSAASQYIGQTNVGGKFSDGRIEAWCADFVDYIGKQTGIKELQQGASVDSFYRYFKSNGKLANTPSKGSIVMYNWGSSSVAGRWSGRDTSKDHIGIVYDYDDKYIYTIEGNTSTGNGGTNAVVQKRRPKDSVNILGYGVYASGTPLGNAQSKNLGIAGENYKPEILIDKATGEKTYIDSPTVIDTTKTDVVGEKQTAKVRNFATGTPTTNSKYLQWIAAASKAFGIPMEALLSILDIETANGTASDTYIPHGDHIAGLMQVSNIAIREIQRHPELMSVLEANNVAIQDINSTQLSKDGTHDAVDYASIFGGAAYYKHMYNTLGKGDWAQAAYYYNGGHGKESADYIESFRKETNSPAFQQVAQEISNGVISAISDNISEEDVKEIVDPLTEKWNNAVNYIKEHNLKKDWAEIGDSEVSAWERVVGWLGDEFPNAIEKLAEAEKNYEEAKLGHIQAFYDRTVDDIGRVQAAKFKEINDIANDSTLSDYEKSQKLYAIKRDLTDEAGQISLNIHNEVYADYLAWLDAVEAGTATWSAEVNAEYRDTLSSITDYAVQVAEDAIKAIESMEESRWKLSDDYISERNFYNDWSLFDDDEVSAWERVVKWLNEEYPDDLEKIKKAEQSLFEARKKAFNDANNYAKTYLDSQKTLLQDYFDIENSIAEARHEINKELETSKTMYEWLDKDSRQLLFNQEDYNKLNKELNNIQRKANILQDKYEYDLKHATLENMEAITNEYDRQYKTLMKSYEIAKADLEIAKKKQKLNNVLNERNVRMFINGSWQWVANTQDVIDAKSELADAEYAKRVEQSGLKQQKSIDEITERQDELNVIIKEFENGVISLKEAVGKAKGAIGSIPEAVEQLYKDAKVDTKAVKSGSSSRSYNGVWYDSKRDYYADMMAASTVEKALELLPERNAKIGGENRSFDYKTEDEVRQDWANYRQDYIKNTTVVEVDGNKETTSYKTPDGLKVTTTSLINAHAKGTSYTPGGLTALGEEGFEAYISSKGKLIPINQPTIGNLPSGGVVFNRDQMKNLRTLWDMSNFNFKGNSGFIGGGAQNVDNSQDNRIIINGMTVDSGSADGQALISALRRYVGNH